MAFPALPIALWGALGLQARDNALHSLRWAEIPVLSVHTALWIGINNDTDRALDRLGNLLHHTPNQPQHYRDYTLGRYDLGMRRDRPERAADYFRRAIAAVPADQPGYRVRYEKNLGAALHRAARHREAVDAFDRAYAAQPSDKFFVADLDYQYLWALSAGVLALADPAWCQ